jgi:hypothetical protein
MDFFSNRFWTAQESADERVVARHAGKPPSMGLEFRPRCARRELPSTLERDDTELGRAGGSLCSVKELWMQDRQVLVGYSIAIQQDVFRATTPGVRKNSVKVRRDVGHGVFRCIYKPAMTGFPSGQLTRHMMARIAEHAIVELPVEPHPCLWR